jgi:hypothetical protein
MTCRRARAAVHQALDERAAQLPRELLEHLAGCADCESMASEFRVLGDAARQLETPTPSDAYFRSVTRRAVTRAKWAGSPDGVRGLRLSWLSASACAAALLFGGVLAGQWLLPGQEGDVVVKEVPVPSGPTATRVVAADGHGGLDAPGRGAQLVGNPEPLTIADEELPDLPVLSVSPPSRRPPRRYVPPTVPAPRTTPVHHVAAPHIEDPIQPALELSPLSTFSGETVTIEVYEGEVLGPFDPTGLMPTQPLDRGGDTVVPALDIAPELLGSSQSMRGA